MFSRVFDPQLRKRINSRHGMIASSSSYLMQSHEKRKDNGCLGDVNQMAHQIKLVPDLRSVGSLPLEEQNVQNSQVGKRRTGFYISCGLDAEHIAELETLIAAVTNGLRIILT